MDAPTASLIGAGLLFIGSIITLVYNYRGNKANTLSRLEEVISKAQDRADKLYDEKVACEVMSEKLRGDLGMALVKITDLEKALAEKIGYIQGTTEQQVKLEQAQKAALIGGRRAEDKV